MSARWSRLRIALSQSRFTDTSMKHSPRIPLIAG
jgi:hypothetical protein